MIFWELPVFSPDLSVVTFGLQGLNNNQSDIQNECQILQTPTWGLMFQGNQIWTLFCPIIIELF